MIVNGCPIQILVGGLLIFSEKETSVTSVPCFSLCLSPSRSVIHALAQSLSISLSHCLLPLSNCSVSFSLFLFVPHAYTANTHTPHTQVHAHKTHAHTETQSQRLSVSPFALSLSLSLSLTHSLSLSHCSPLCLSFTFSEPPRNSSKAQYLLFLSSDPTASPRKRRR